VASVVAAVLTYFLIERPARKVSRLWPDGFILKGTAALCAVYIAFGAAISLRLVQQNYPQIIRTLDASGLDRAEWRDKDCFLDVKGGIYQPQCFDPVSAGKPTIVLWGDSYAAALYPGLDRRRDRDKFRLVQLTASSCPPLPNLPNPPGVRNCTEENATAADFIAKARPDVLIIAARWFMYDFSELPSLLKNLKASGIPKIVVVGTFPNWDQELPTTLINTYLSSGKIPERLHSNSEGTNALWDRKTALVALAAGVSYASPQAMLCNQDGCLTHLPDSETDLTSFDFGHLSVSASIYFAHENEALMGIASQETVVSSIAP
jgi:hypothetical protein